jgi:hypothetical protein
MPTRIHDAGSAGSLLDEAVPDLPQFGIGNKADPGTAAILISGLASHERRNPIRDRL